MPDRPAPTTATRPPLAGSFGGLSTVSVCSTQYRSRLPMANGSPTSARLQNGRQGWSQSRPIRAGNGMVRSRMRRASRSLPRAMAAMKPRTSTWMGQAAVQKGWSSWMQRASSSLSWR